MVLRKQRLHRAALIVLLSTVVVAYLLIAQWRGEIARVHAQSMSSAPHTVTAVNRDFDPVIVKNVLVGTAADEIYVYRLMGGTWEPIPYQIDMVSNGTYQSTPVDTLDADDEIVFMARDLGEMATTGPDEDLAIIGQWIEVEVTDPLNTDDKGYAYIVRSTSGLSRSNTDYVDFNATTRRATSDNYEVGWADEHSGLEHLSLFGSGNVIDRTKTRISANVPPFGLVTITENGNAQIPVGDVVLIKDGPVRVIVERSSVITICYPSMLRTVLNIELPNSVTIASVRTSTDLASNVTGTYYNENVPAGVAIDGTPDSVGTTPFNAAWRQVALASGAMIQVTDLSNINGFPQHYYKDDAAVDDDDTGDKQSYGDSGFLVNSVSGSSFTLDSSLYFLEGTQGNRGSEFLERYANPVAVATELQGEPVASGAKLFLPFAEK